MYEQGTERISAQSIVLCMTATAAMGSKWT